MYHAFISYSHAADGHLAPKLQQALERLAKPWYKLRNLNIFRDESTLSVSPHLWDNITKALDASEHFILMASPQSAESKWVNMEIAYWLEHKSIETLIVVLTDGEIRWNQDTNSCIFDANTALSGSFAEQLDQEPFYIDLRSSNTQQDISLSNPIFKKEVLKIAAHIHGMTPKDLASAEVKAHKRMMRLRNTVIIVLLALLSFSIFKTFEAEQQRKLAERQRDRAMANNYISEAQREGTPSIALAYAKEALELHTNDTIRDIANSIYANNYIGKRIVFNQHIIYLDSITFLPGNQEFLTYGDIDDLNEKNPGFDYERLRYFKNGDSIYAKGTSYQLWDLEGNLLDEMNRHTLEERFGDPFAAYRMSRVLNNQLPINLLNWYTADIDLDISLDRIRRIYWHQDNKQLVSTWNDGAIRIWDRASGIQSKYQLEMDEGTELRNEVIFTISEDNRYMLVAYRKRIELWDLTDKGLLSSTEFNGQMNCFTFESTGNAIRLRSADTTFSWDWKKKDTVRIQNSDTLSCLSNKQLPKIKTYVGGDFNHQLLLDTEEHLDIQVLITQPEQDKIRYHLVAPSGEKILIGTEKKFSVYTQENDSLVSAIPFALEFDYPVPLSNFRPLDAVFAADESMILTKGRAGSLSDGQTIIYHLWDVNTGELLKQYPSEPFLENSDMPSHNFGFSPKGNYIFIKYRKALTLWKCPVNLNSYLNNGVLLSLPEINASKIELIISAD